MFVPEWISSNVLNFETEKSRAYISNRKTFELFWLQKDSSDLWYVILNSKNMGQILSYAKEKNLENELSDFLLLLKQKGLFLTLEEQKDIQQKRQNSFVSKDSDFLKLWSQQNIKEQKLTRIQFDVTYKCNLNCVHFFNDKTVNDVQISFSDIKPIIDEAYELGVTQIVLSGGECTLIDDFLDIAKYIKSKRIELVFFTNGQKMYDDPKFFDEIIKLYPHYIGLSLYSMNSDIHEKITCVKGSHHKTLKVIEKLEENNVPVEVKIFLTKYNANNYQDVVNYAITHNFRYGVDECLLPNPDYSNLYTQIEEKQLEKLYRFQIKNKLIKVNNVINEKFLNDFPCLSGRTTLDIDPFLNVTSCPTANFNFANLRKITLKELWESNDKNSPLNKWSSIKRKDFTECFKYDYCKYCNFCPGKCTDEHTKVNILCKNAKIKMNIAKEYE